MQTANPIQLVSNGYTLSTAPNRLGRLVPTDPARPLPALRDQLRAQGYLWLKGFLKREVVLNLRRRYFELMQPTGIVEPGTDLQLALFSGKPDTTGLHQKLLMEFVRSAAYESFCLQPQLWEFYDTFLGGASYLHKRKIVRDTFPNDPRSTGAHYDLVYLRGGTDTVLTSWIPLGDTPVEMGGLIYLEGSDALGRQFEDTYTAQNATLPPEERVSAYNKNMKGGWLNTDLPALADRADSRWLVADYEAGDVVVHTAYMVHAATLNVDPHRRIRLSTDIRYQRVRDEIDARWANHWSLDDML